MKQNYQNRWKKNQKPPHLKSQSCPNRVQRIREGHRRQTSPSSSHELINVRLRPEHAIQVPLVNLKRRKLGGSIGEYPDHLGAVAFVEGDEGLAGDDVSEAAEDTVALVMAVVRLEKDLDAVEGGHGGLGDHASNAC